MLSGTQRFILLMTMIIGLVVLAGVLGLGRSTEKESFGLRDVILILGVLAPQIARDGGRQAKEEKKEETPKEP